MLVTVVHYKVEFNDYMYVTSYNDVVNKTMVNLDLINEIAYSKMDFFFRNFYLIDHL